MSVEAINAKKIVVEEIAGKFKESQSAVLVEYRGLSVADVTELRRALREEDVELKVYKNKLVQRATESVGYADLNDKLVDSISFSLLDCNILCIELSNSSISNILFECINIFLK